MTGRRRSRQTTTRVSGCVGWGRPVNDAFLLLIGTQQLTICVNLAR
jgi:hypothetical protein